MSKEIDAMKTIAIIAALWIACGLIAGGFFNADHRSRFPELPSTPERARETCAMSMGFGLIGGPISLMLSPFLTGFYQYGWTISCAPMKP